MPGVLRNILRRMGRDITRYPPEDRGRRNLLAIMGRFNVNLVLDVGANVGQYASQLRQAGYRGRIVSFEPVSTAHAELARTAAADPGWLVAPQMALGSEDGRIAIQISNRTDMSSILPIREETLVALPKSYNVGCEEVPVARLDRIFDEYAGAGDRPFLKVDTQGFERQVLVGATGVLDRLAGIQLEMSLQPLYSGEAGYLELIAYLDERGFEPALILPGYFSKQLGRQLQIDGVFVRSETGA